MLTIRMNESAAAALQPLRLTAALSAADLQGELRAKLSQGVVEPEGALISRSDVKNGDPLHHGSSKLGGVEVSAVASGCGGAGA
ncbi:hypothetical protein ACVCAH_37535 [Micromonospora sp. LZ34]